ncbi:MAG TPA: hydrogenase accessory protein HypB [Euryarchaeota archaeon]|nr:hydrogenase accessory protein HypB [Euryarchaeota archaeon]
MHQVDISVEEKVLRKNLEIAHRNEDFLNKRGITAVDFTGAIGSGKTLLIEDLVEEGKRRGINCAVIAGDAVGFDDYNRFKTHRVVVENINTGKECHLDAHLVEHALERMNLQGVEYLFIENVGNLLCPGDFPLGTHLRIVVVSTTEGDDMVRKHPNIFSLSDAMILNKSDLAVHVGVDINTVISDFLKVAPRGRYFVTDARGKSGIEELADFLFDTNRNR